MKKALFIAIFITLLAITAMSSVGFAETIGSQQIGVEAVVNKYAAITVVPISYGNIGTFSGKPNEEIPDGTGIFTVETNANLDLKFDFTLLSNEVSGDSLLTYFKIYRHLSSGNGWLTSPNDTYVAAPKTFTGAQAQKTTASYDVTIMAKTHDTVSGQAAGEYAGTVKLTVSSPP